jgi:uncharacterized surface protein with fasciclin (FAS1) repeats
MNSRLSFAFLFALLLGGPAVMAQDSDASDAEAADLIATLDERGDFTVLVGALRDTGLDAALATGETFTLFAPTDAAFQALPAGTLENLTPEQLTEVLRYHLIVGAVPSQDAAALSSAPSVQGSELALSSADGQLTVDGATVTEADIQASNGVIHVIDTVLMPDSGMGEGAVDDGMMEKEMHEGSMHDEPEPDMEDDGGTTPAPQP